VLVSGANGAGKTNLLEALHVGTQGFSPRARNDAQLVRFGETAGRVQLVGTRIDAPVEVDVVFAPGDTRRIRLNGSALRSADELRATLQTLVFTPDRLGVVKGGPAARRAYFDRSLGRLFPSRAQLPAEYGAAVAQRNAALRRVSLGASSVDALAPWSERVTELGTDLVAARQDTLKLLAPVYERTADTLGLSSATLAYEGEPVTSDALEARLSRDLERGVTGAGPHLHEIRVEAGGRDLRSYGSQGEQRVAVLALVLGEAKAIAERSGAPPLVLLDDVLSELDGERRRSLGELILDGGQTVVTTTAAAALPVEPAQSLVVTPGAVAEAA
jgi:DNA replication and repair protein RecF